MKTNLEYQYKLECLNFWRAVMQLPQNVQNDYEYNKEKRLLVLHEALKIYDKWPKEYRSKMRNFIMMPKIKQEKYISQHIF